MAVCLLHRLQGNGGSVCQKISLCLPLPLFRFSFLSSCRIFNTVAFTFFFFKSKRSYKSSEPNLTTVSFFFLFLNHARQLDCWRCQAWNLTDPCWKPPIWFVFSRSVRRASNYQQERSYCCQLAQMVVEKSNWPVFNVTEDSSNYHQVFFCFFLGLFFIQALSLSYSP